MKDIPCFSTENGVASLSLQQIPYSGLAHITVHSTQNLDAFLEECVDFCRVIGADRILACGHDDLVKYPIYSRILRMQAQMPEDNGECCLFPLTENTLNTWTEIYNTAMRTVPNAEILSKCRVKELMERGTAYFVHRDGALLGVGVAHDCKIDAIVSCHKGAGEQVLKTLCGVLYGDLVEVEVAENNLPALRLYNRLGFVNTGIIKTWYDVYKKI